MHHIIWSPIYFILAGAPGSDTASLGTSRLYLLGDHLYCTQFIFYPKNCPFSFTFSYWMPLRNRSFCYVYDVHLSKALARLVVSAVLQILLSFLNKCSSQFHISLLWRLWEIRSFSGPFCSIMFQVIFVLDGWFFQCIYSEAFWIPLVSFGSS